MENNLNMNEEVVDIVEETVNNAGRSNFWECCGVIGFACIAGYGVYRGIKWMITKSKEKKASKKESDIEVDLNSAED